MKHELKDTHIYFPVKTLEGLKKMAATNHRTMSAEIVMAVEAKLQEWKLQRQNQRDWSSLCSGCGSALTSTDWQAGECTQCHVPLKGIK